MKKRKIYIAGKITGDSDFEKKFRDVKEHFEKLGYVVLNPAELPKGMSPGDYMRVCFSMIDISDLVYFIPDYKDSLGAKLELEYVRYIGKDAIFKL